MPSQSLPTQPKSSQVAPKSNPLPVVGLVVSGIHVFALQFVLILAIFPIMFNDTGGPLPWSAWLFPFFFGLVIPAYMIAILVLSVMSLKNHGARAPRYKKPLATLLLIEGVLVGLVVLGGFVYSIITYIAISQVRY
jgi:hypothetical protein